LTREKDSAQGIDNGNHDGDDAAGQEAPAAESIAVDFGGEFGWGN